MKLRQRPVSDLDLKPLPSPPPTHQQHAQQDTQPNTGNVQQLVCSLAWIQGQWWGEGARTRTRTATLTHPRILPSAQFLLTGASGFVAIHIAQALLADGYQVVGTVRSPDKVRSRLISMARTGRADASFLLSDDSLQGEWLKENLFKNDKFSFVIVEDVMAPGAFDDVVEGVEGIVHSVSLGLVPPA